MYKLTDKDGHVFLTVEGVPLGNNTCLLLMEKYGDVPNDFDLSILFDYLHNDGYQSALMFMPAGHDIPGWIKVGECQAGWLWSVEVVYNV